MSYELDLEKASDLIKKHGAKRVLIQLPDGLKPRAGEIVTELSRTGAKILIFAGSNFGACDLPTGLDQLRIDLLIHFGHSKWVVN